MVVINELDIRNQPQKTLQQCCEFLGVDTSHPFPSSSKRIHEGRASLTGIKLADRAPIGKRVIRRVDSWLAPNTGKLFQFTAEDIQKLHQIYDAENQRLFEILDQPLPDSWQASQR
ncbi:MAG: hypothetical protein ACO4CG_11895 [Prochlorothrix sp.]